MVSFGGFVALVSVGTWHVVWGWAKWLGYAPAQASPTESQRHLTKKRRWYAINGVSFALTALWLAGSLGIVGRGGKTDGWIGREFDELYNAMPLVRW